MYRNLKQTGFTKKRQAAFVTLVLTFLLLLTGTFAWQDYSQHKSNEFNTKAMDHNVVLVEDFEPVQDWSVHDNQGKQDKTVFVRNGQEGNAGLDDAFIRIQLKEYMDITKLKQTYSDKRFMIDTTGDFIRVKKSEVTDVSDAEIKLQAKIDAANINYTVTEDSLSVKTGYFDAEAYYYIITKQDDPNGQYGKFLTLTQEKDGDPQQITKGVGRQRPTTEAQHEADSNAECTYTPIKWDKNAVSTGHERAEEVAIREGHTDSSGNTSDGAKEFVKLLLNESATDSNVITYQSWQDDYNKEPVSKWILDTSGEATDKGYIYWGEPLVSGHRTKDLVEGVQLTKQPRGTAYYVLHVDMEAFSLDEMSHNNIVDIPVDLKDMYTNKSTDSIKIQANEAIRNSDKRDDFGLKISDRNNEELDLNQLQIELISATDKSGSKRLPLDQELFEFDKSTKRASIHPLINGKVEAKFKLTKGDQSQEVTTIFDASYKVTDLIKLGKQVNDSSKAKYFKVLFVADQNENINNLKKNTILVIDEKNLTKEEFDSISHELPQSSYREIEESDGFSFVAFRFTKDFKYPQKGYKATEKGSTIGIKSALDAYYDAFIHKNALLEDYILDYHKPNEYDEDLYDRAITDDKAYRKVIHNSTKPKEGGVPVDSATGKMFILGISDIHTYLDIPMTENHLAILHNEQTFWLSSPGDTEYRASYIDDNGYLTRGRVDFRDQGLRSAFFVHFN